MKRIFTPIRTILMKLKIYMLLYQCYLYFIITIRFMKMLLLKTGGKKITQEEYKKHYNADLSYLITDYRTNKELYVSRYGLPQIEGFKDWINNRYIYLQSEVRSIPHQTILDVGCGVGLFTNLLTRNFPESTITGFDFSIVLARIARKYINSSSVSVINASALQLPFKAMSFDIIITSYVLMYFKYEMDIILREIHRVAKSTVIFIEPFTEFMGPFHKMYHYANDYPQIKKAVDGYFHQEKFYPIPYGTLVQSGGLFVGHKR